MEKEPDFVVRGQQAYKQWRDEFLANPEYRKIYEEEAAKKELWLQLVEARQRAVLIQAELAKRLSIAQAQVARIENRDYDVCTLNALRRYVQALDNGISPEVSVHQNPSDLP